MQACPAANILYIKQHPKDCCLSRLSLKPGDSILDAHFYEWDTIVGHMTSLLELWFNLRPEFASVTEIAIENLGVGKPQALEALSHIIDLVPEPGFSVTTGNWLRVNSPKATYNQRIEIFCDRLGYIQH